MEDKENLSICHIYVFIHTEITTNVTQGKYLIAVNVHFTDFIYNIGYYFLQILDLVYIHN